MNPELKLLPITDDNMFKVSKLSETLTPSQRKCVADNMVSFAQAGFNDSAWPRAVYLGDEPIGFIMIERYPTVEDFPKDEQRVIYLWRYMIAQPWQGKGYGKQILDTVMKHFADQGVKTMYTSCVKEEADTPYGFYMNYGFTDTGIVDSGEQVLKYPLPNAMIKPMEVKPLPAFPRIALVTLWTENLVAMKDFYHRVLGFFILLDGDQYVEFENNGTRFALCNPRVMESYSPQFLTKPSGQRVELAFPCEKPEDVDASYELLIAQGAEVISPPQNTEWGQRMALFADPDGNIHEIFADKVPGQS